MLFGKINKLLAASTKVLTTYLRQLFSNLKNHKNKNEEIYVIELVWLFP